VKKTGEIDIKLGANIVKHRLVAGLSRKDLAEQVGITHQQMQKYENGINRISVARLYEIAKVLKISVHSLLCTENVSADIELDTKTKTEIYKYLNRVKDEAKLEAIKNLVKSIAASETINDNYKNGFSGIGVGINL
jgi:transcriptional regulator with XRE-family HTH domain